MKDQAENHYNSLPIETLAEEFLNLSRRHCQCEQILRSRLKPLGLTPAQYTIIKQLYSKGKMSLADLKRELDFGIDAGRRVSELTDLGLVIRSGKMIILSAEGRKVARRGIGISEEV